jgi:site-specific recombinase XerD
MILEFLSDLEHTRGNSIQTRNYRLISIRCLFEYIATRDPLWFGQCSKITSIPTKRGAKLPEIHYLTKEEIESILRAARTLKSASCRDQALLQFMYNSGARAQETADAKISWFSLRSPPKVEILGKGQKWRTCPLWDSTAQILQRLINERTQPSQNGEHLFFNRFGGPITRHGIADIIRKHVRVAATEVPGLRTKTVTPHVLRHTTAMHLLQSGVEVNVIRSWLGHVSIATTNRYVEIDLEMKTKALKTCEVHSTRSTAGPAWKTSPDILRWLESL